MERTALSRLRRAGFMAVLLSASTVWCAQEAIKLADDRQIKAQADTEFRFDLGQIPRGKQVRLRLDARIEWGSLGGSTGAVALYVNGKGLVGRHLINKPLVYAMRNDVELAWGSETGCGYRLMYSPDFSDRIKTDETYEYGTPDTDPYHFVWDITSYVRAGGNVVRICAAQGMSFSLRLRNVAVEVGDPLPSLSSAAQQRETTTEPAPAGPLPVFVPGKPAEIPATIGVSSAGRIRFRIGNRQFGVRTRTSLPKGEWSEGGRAKDVWSKLRRGKTITTQWMEAGYSVEQQVTLHRDRISVADTIRNTCDELLGVVLEVRLELPEKPKGVLLAGHVVKRLKQRSSPSHPTAMAEFDNLAIGLIAEDDIFRVHCKAFVEDGALALSDPQLGIAPGKEHTLEWSVYPVPDGDHWDFVNAVRRNWGSNLTLRGPSKWIHPAGVPGKAESANQWLEKAGMVTLCNPMFGTEEERTRGITIQHGTALLLCKDWCDLAGKAVRVLKEAAPTVETFIYTHQNLCTEPGHEGKYQDSRAVDITGTPATTVYFPSPSLFLPTLENSYGKAMMDICRYIVERLDANIYIDEITASNVPAFGAYPNAWDGCTVAIDPVSHAVTGKRSSAILLMQPWRAVLMDYLKSRGKTVIANGPHYTRTMLSWGVQCFVESEPEDNAVVAAHLSHPLCLAQYANPDARVRYDAARRLLDRAGIQFTAFSAEAPVFPITPLELRAGVVIGKERILTNRSGRFGWGDDSLAEAHVFDGQGNRVHALDVKHIRQGPKVLMELQMPKDYFAILVRTKG